MANTDSTPRRKPGRPEGSHQTLARKAREQAAATGLLPHEILLDMARGNPQRQYIATELADGDVTITPRWVTLTVEDQKDAAKAAAPYYAPKLSAVEVAKGLGDAELDQLIKQLAQETGIAVAVGGEGGEDEEGEGARGAGSSNRRRRDLD